MLLTGLLVYGLMGFAPGIPKRIFMPVCLFIPVVYVGILPLLGLVQPACHGSHVGRCRWPRCCWRFSPSAGSRAG